LHVAADRTRVTGSERAEISSRRSIGSTHDDKEDTDDAMSIVGLDEVAPIDSGAVRRVVA
jgi:hypothetical protein